ncbi:ankyrin repeat domain-containing protein [Rickettsia rhipicephali]|uniref:ankyrin repeat domain-containing protein n=1 Tax=Rickettsia rhipicephali TaxID=33992 RepID=UPI000B2C5A67
MEGLISQGANKYKALEFALKNNNAQAEYLLNHLTFEPNPSLIQAIHNKSLILVKYFVEEKPANVNFSHYDSNTLNVTAGLKEPYKTDITCDLLIKGATYLNTTLEETAQGGQNVNDLHKQIFFKAINENKLEVIKKFVEIYGFDVNTEYRFNTSLSTANLKNRKEIAKYLLSKNANLDVALEITIIYGNLNAVKTLLEMQGQRLTAIKMYHL